MEREIKYLEPEDGSMLRALVDAHIVGFEQIGAEVFIEECCDNYFAVKLTKERFGQFIAELQSIHDKM